MMLLSLKEIKHISYGRTKKQRITALFFDYYRFELHKS